MDTGEGVIGCVKGCVQDIIGCEFEVDGVECCVCVFFDLAELLSLLFLSHISLSFMISACARQEV